MGLCRRCRRTCICRSIILTLIRAGLWPRSLTGEKNGRRSNKSNNNCVKKVDVSTLNTNAQGETCSRVTIDQVWYDVGGLRAALEFDATSNVVALVLGGSAAAGPVSGHFDFRSFGGIKNNAGSGITGDIDLTTHGHTNHDHYTITLELRKSY